MPVDRRVDTLDGYPLLQEEHLTQTNDCTPKVIEAGDLVDRELVTFGQAEQRVASGDGVTHLGGALLQNPSAFLTASKEEMSGFGAPCRTVTDNFIPDSVLTLLITT